MKRLFYLMMVGAVFTALQITSVGAQDAATSTVDISHCADMPPTTRPACEAQAHAGPPGGPGHHPPADCGGVPCPTAPGGPGHHPPGSMPPGEAMCFDAATNSEILCSDMPGANPNMTPPPSGHHGGGCDPNLAPDAGGCPDGYTGAPGGPGHHPPGGPGHHPPGSMPPGEAMCFDAATNSEILCSAMPGADPNMTPPPSSHPGGPGHHPPADCGGVPCPTGHDGGPDGPPIDPRSGQPFTAADEAKYQVYADECKTSGGTISAASLAILMADGFTEPMVNGLCQKSAHDGPPPAP